MPVVERSLNLTRAVPPFLASLTTVKSAKENSPIARVFQ
jgi:hypothetical protein